VEESISILKKLVKKKRPKKLLGQEPKAKKIFNELILNEVKGIKELIELKKKINNLITKKDLQKFFKEGDSIKEKINFFVESNMLGKKFDINNSGLIEERILKSNLKNKDLMGFIHKKKQKKINDKKRKNDIFNLYKQDPTMLVIEFNRNKNIKIERKPSIDNLVQGKKEIKGIIN
jgi:hypothetical protein